jgi:hypothetical protein
MRLALLAILKYAPFTRPLAAPLLRRSVTAAAKQAERFGVHDKDAKVSTRRCGM